MGFCIRNTCAKCSGIQAYFLRNFFSEDFLAALVAEIHVSFSTEDREGIQAPQSGLINQDIMVPHGFQAQRFEPKVA